MTASNLDHRKYSPVNACIYCGCEPGIQNLSDEHIVPKGLGGTMILPKSSCERCRVVTARIEEICLRRMFGDIRHLRKLTSKRRKKGNLYRPSPMYRRTPSGLESYEAPESKSRVDAIALPVFTTPGILQGRHQLSLPSEQSDLIWVFGSIGSESERHTVTELGFNNNMLTKMLAKIGHSFAVAELGWGSFKPLIGPNIVGNAAWFPNQLVGGELEPTENSEFQTEVGVRKIDALDGAPFTMVRIRIFGDIGAPVYYVVVGTG